MTTIPTSGAFLRAFARARMTAGTRHVATAIASAISYDGKYRGAPRGYAAFTMNELQEITGLAARTIQVALIELAEMFGLMVTRRHHQRHFFRFTRVAAGTDAVESTELPDSAPDDGVTRIQMRVTPYVEEQGNNDCSVRVKVKEGENVFRTPWASFIERFKRGTPAEKIDTQFLWNGFCGLNRRNGHEVVPLRFLIGFLKKHPGKRTASTASPATPEAAKPIPTADKASLKLVELAQPAPFENRHFHRSDLQHRIGSDAYEARIKIVMERFNCGRFQAEHAVHGEAVRCGEIGR